jgi:hypothetical protein
MSAGGETGTREALINLLGLRDALDQKVRKVHHLDVEDSARKKIWVVNYPDYMMNGGSLNLKRPEGNSGLFGLQEVFFS